MQYSYNVQSVNLASLPDQSRRLTESVSFRLDEGDLAQLRDMARLRKMSLNSLVSQVFDRYLKLWVYNASYGFIPVNEEILRQGLSKMNDREIEKTAHSNAVRTHVEMIRYIHGELTPEAVVDYLDIFGQRFRTYKHFTKGSRHTVTIFHGVSLQFSKLYYTILKEILRSANFKIIESKEDVRETGFSITFEPRTLTSSYLRLASNTMKEDDEGQPIPSFNDKQLPDGAIDCFRRASQLVEDIAAFATAQLIRVIPSTGKSPARTPEYGAIPHLSHCGCSAPSFALPMQQGVLMLPL